MDSSSPIQQQHAKKEAVLLIISVHNEPLTNLYEGSCNVPNWNLAGFDFAIPDQNL